MPEKENPQNVSDKAIELLALGIDLLEGKKGERGDKGDKGDKGEDSTVPGPVGPQGEVGPQGPAGKDGKDGKDGKPGRDGKDGKEGKQGPRGEKGDTGPQGPAGKDAEPLTPATIIDVTLPTIIQTVQKSVASKTYSADEIEGLAEFVASNSSGTDWTYYATTWSVEPTLNASITGGDVYNYTLDGVTRYRFVPTTYDATEDAFYTTFSGGLLTGLIVSRG